MGALGGAALGTRALAGSLYSSTPVVEITSPTTAVTTSTITVTWTYSSAVSRPQVRYRVQLLLGGNSIYTSGWVTSAATSHPIPTALSSFSLYELIVEADDLLDIGSDSTEFLVQLQFDELHEEPNPDVGLTYEVGINGVGYMLADTPERRVQRQVVQLDSQPPGDDSPLSERIERYNIVSHIDWRGGEGQQRLNRPTSDPSRYRYSEGVNPFEPGQITCLPQTPLLVTDNYAEQQVTATAGDLYVRTADAELTRVTSAGATTAFNPGLAGTPPVQREHLTSDGLFWYITDGTTIRRNNIAANPGGNWSTVAVTDIAWCSDRIAGLDTAASPPNFTTFSPTGTEEVVGGRFSHTGAALAGLCGGDGYMWYGVNRGDTGEVRFWQVDSTPTVSGTALTLPQGETVFRLFFYLGNVFVVALVGTGVQSADRKIYRCVPSAGTLTPELILDGLTIAPRNMAGRGRFVAFSWSSMQRTGENGIGVLDLDSGGIARWYAGTSTTGNPVWVAPTPWAADDFAFSIATEGLRGRTAAQITTPTYREGFLETSTSDLGSSLFKHLDALSLTCLPLQGEIELLWSIDNGVTFNHAAMLDAQGAVSLLTHAHEEFGHIIGPTFALRVNLMPTVSGLGAPTVVLFGFRAHIGGMSDELISLPINCADYLRGLGGEDLGGGPGSGLVRIRTLQSLLGQQVAFQDVDWRRTQQVGVFELVGVQSETDGVLDRNEGTRVDSGHAVVALRRPVA